MFRVYQAAPEDWKAWAYLAIRYIAKRRAEMTTDPVWYMLEAWDVPGPPEPRALGPVMRGAAALGWIEATNRTHKSVRPGCHRRDLRVYRSCLFGLPGLTVEQK